ncbi:MAG: hypothetical protein GEU86_21965 [Actinophytocola sp.]|nr:hypothetical protein [Actinophytocola sp.]
MSDGHGQTQVGVERDVAVGRLLRYGAGAASLAAAAVHASAIAGHADVPLHLTAFVVMTLFQAWWSFLVLRSPTRKVLLAGVLGHGAIIVVWLLSRTVGFPGPGGLAVEPLGFKDGAATVLAVVTLGAIAALLRPRASARLVRPSIARAVLGALMVFVLALGVLGVSAIEHRHGEEGPHHEHHR